MVFPPQPVILQQAQIKIEASALHQLLECPRTEHHGRQARGGAETLLRAAEAHVESPSRSYRSCGRRTRSTVSTMTRAPCFLAIAASCAIGFRTPVDVFGVDHCDNVELLRANSRAQGVRVARAAPFNVQSFDGRSVSFTHVREPFAEVSGDDDEDACAVGDEVRNARLHSGGACAGHSKRERAVRRIEQPRKTYADIVEHRRHERIQMADRGRSHRAHHPGRGHAGPGAQRMREVSGEKAHAATSSSLASAFLSEAIPASWSGISGGRGTPTSKPRRFRAAFNPGTPHIEPTS